MKTYLLLLFLGFTSLFLSAQSIGNEHSVWTFRPQRMNFFDPIVAYQVHYQKDTIINGQEYQQFGKDYQPSTFFYLRNANGRVYFYEGIQEKLWFDFNLHAGDTLTYQVPQIANPDYDIIAGAGFTNALLSYAIIDSVKIENIGNQLLNTFYTSSIDANFSQSDMDWNLGKVVERIGGFNKGLFGTSSTQLLWGIGDGELTCYQDKIVNYKKAGVTNCHQYVEIEKSLTSPAIQFSFTPSEHLIYVTFSSEIRDNVTFSCYNFLGQKVNINSKQTADNQVKVEILAEEGGYFLLLHWANGQQINYKFFL